MELLEACTRVREARVRCATYPWAKYCVYTYKTADWRVFRDKPCLLYSRGTVVVEDRSGGIHVFLPFTKFFNAGETDYTLYNRLSRLEIGSVYEKLDGTLIVAWRDPVTGDLRVNTRGSLWSHPGSGDTPDPEARLVNPFARGLVRYLEENRLKDRLERILDDKWTVMFELVVPGMAASRAYNRPEEYMEAAQARGVAYLLAYRGTAGHLEEPGESEWPHQPTRLEAPGSPEELGGIVEGMGIEGVVAWYRRSPYQGPLEGIDPLVKFKSRTYLFRVTGLQSKRSILAYTLQGGVDDLAGMVDPEELEVLRRIHAEYQRLLRGIEELRRRREVLRRRGITVRGLIARGLENPERLHGEVVASAPRDYEKALSFLERLNRTVERILAKLSG
ncbi:MAG: hypothetical protein F7B18_08105 [Desulfurococcales archaeon]|nr:hypothetical protein [Desulfurococcales archaeon]